MKALCMRVAIGALAALPIATSLAGETTYSFSWYAGPTVANFPAPMTLRAGMKNAPAAAVPRNVRRVCLFIIWPFR